MVIQCHPIDILPTDPNIDYDKVNAIRAKLAECGINDIPYSDDILEQVVMVIIEGIQVLDSNYVL